MLPVSETRFAADDICKGSPRSTHVQGFTTGSTKLDSTAPTNLMDQWFTSISGVIRRHLNAICTCAGEWMLSVRVPVVVAPNALHKPVAIRMRDALRDLLPDRRCARHAMTASQLLFSPGAGPSRRHTTTCPMCITANGCNQQGVRRIGPNEIEANWACR